MKNVAVRGNDGRLALLSARAGRYSAEHWLLADGDAASLAEAAERGGFRCDPLGCAARMTNGRWLAVVRHPAIIAEECRRADVVVAAVPIRGACPGPRLVIRRRALRRGGSHAVRWRDGSYQVTRANDLRGARPWVKRPPAGEHAAGGGKSVSSSGG